MQAKKPQVVTRIVGNAMRGYKVAIGREYVVCHKSYDEEVFEPILTFNEEFIMEEDAEFFLQKDANINQILKLYSKSK